MNDFCRYVAIEKVDPDQRMVWGYASTPQIDSQGDRVSVKAIEDALPDYMRFANIREMHKQSAVGKTKTAEIDESGLYIGAKVVDEEAWVKVKEGVYNGFSIGGEVKSRNGDEITGLSLVEISLVDRPANPGAIFDVWKSDSIEPVTPTTTVAPITYTITPSIVEPIVARVERKGINMDRIVKALGLPADANEDAVVVEIARLAKCAGEAEMWKARDADHLAKLEKSSKIAREAEEMKADLFIEKAKNAFKITAAEGPSFKELYLNGPDGERLCKQIIDARAEQEYLKRCQALENVREAPANPLSEVESRAAELMAASEKFRGKPGAAMVEILKRDPGLSARYREASLAGQKKGGEA